jgi:flagellar hook-basal body complex protein FliE
MGNLPRSLADLEFKNLSLDNSNCFEEKSFKKAFHRHWKDKNFNEMERKIAEEYQNLKEAALEMNEAEAAFHKMMQLRQKLVDVYRHLLVKSKTKNLSQ